MDELNADERLAALEGWATNPAVPVPERLTAALQVLAGLRARENERVRAAVVLTLHYVHTSWVSPESDPADLVETMKEAEEQVRTWTIEGGWCCPFCEEVTCDEGCPLEQMRGALE